MIEPFVVTFHTFRRTLCQFFFFYHQNFRNLQNRNGILPSQIPPRQSPERGRQQSLPPPQALRGLNFADRSPEQVPRRATPQRHKVPWSTLCPTSTFHILTKKSGNLHRQNGIPVLENLKGTSGFVGGAIFGNFPHIWAHILSTFHI